MNKEMILAAKSDPLKMNELYEFYKDTLLGSYRREYSYLKLSTAVLEEIFHNVIKMSVEKYDENQNMLFTNIVKQCFNQRMKEQICDEIFKHQRFEIMDYKVFGNETFKKLSKQKVETNLITFVKFLKQMDEYLTLEDYQMLIETYPRITILMKAYVEKDIQLCMSNEQQNIFHKLLNCYQEELKKQKAKKKHRLAVIDGEETIKTVTSQNLSSKKPKIRKSIRNNLIEYLDMDKETLKKFIDQELTVKDQNILAKFYTLDYIRNEIKPENVTEQNRLINLISKMNRKKNYFITSQIESNSLVTESVKDSIIEKETNVEKNVKKDKITVKEPKKETFNPMFHLFSVFDREFSLNTIQTLSMTDYFITALHCGFINDKYYSVEALANFLEMSTEEVRNCIYRGLTLYRETINETMKQEIDQRYQKTK